MKLYQNHKYKINDIYNFAIIGEDDLIFNISAQKEFYGKRLNIVKNARHNLFFRIIVINKYLILFSYKK